MKKNIGAILGFFAVVVLVMPALNAQDEKKAEKKDVEKNKDDEKKPEPKTPVEKLVYGQKLVTKVKRLSEGSLFVEIQELDPKKVYDFNVWKNQQSVNLAKQQYSIQTQRDFKARFTAIQNYQKSLATFQQDVAKRQTQLYSTKELELRAGENAKYRTLYPPVEFDDQGFEKKWTKKELDERRDKTGLPGFAVETDALKAGQVVEVYLAKVAPAKKKKGPDEDLELAPNRPEYVMIVILPGGPR